MDKMHSKQIEINVSMHCSHVIVDKGVNSRLLASLRQRAKGREQKLETEIYTQAPLLTQI